MAVLARVMKFYLILPIIFFLLALPMIRAQPESDLVVYVAGWKNVSLSNNTTPLVSATGKAISFILDIAISEENKNVSSCIVYSILGNGTESPYNIVSMNNSEISELKEKGQLNYSYLLGELEEYTHYKVSFYVKCANGQEQIINKTSSTTTEIYNANVYEGWVSSIENRENFKTLANRVSSIETNMNDPIKTYLIPILSGLGGIFSGAFIVWHSVKGKLQKAQKPQDGIG